MALTLSTLTPEQKAQRDAEKAAWLNSTLDGYLCDENGIYVDPVTGKKFMSRARINGAVSQSLEEERANRGSNDWRKQ